MFEEGLERTSEARFIWYIIGWKYGLQKKLCPFPCYIVSRSVSTIISTELHWRARSIQCNDFFFTITETLPRNGDNTDMCEKIYMVGKSP